MFPQNLVIVRHAEDISKLIMRELDLNPNDEELIRKLGTQKDWSWKLTPKGIKETQRVGPLYRRLFPSFRGCKPDLRVSPIVRAMQTASVFSEAWTRLDRHDANQAIPINWKIDVNLRERSWGECNMSWVQFEKQQPKLNQAFKCDPYQFRHPSLGAESLADLVATRVPAFLSSLERDCNEDSFVVVISHADWILACRSVLEGIDPYEFKKRFLDLSSYPHHLEGIWYKTNASNSNHPYKKARIHFPEELTSFKDFPPLIWEIIEPKRYSPQELAALVSL